MAKANMVGVSGAALSLVSAGTLSFVALATYSMGTSLTSDFNNDMHDVMGRLALVYTAGAIIGLLSQLGASLQLPSLVIGLPFAWYFNHPVLYVIYFVGLLGTSLLILSMFVEYSLADKGLKAPPFSRIRTWTLGEAGSGARPLPKRGIIAILAVLCACLIAIAAFTAYAWRSSVSELHIEFVTDGSRYGSVNISISVDGEEVYTTYIPYDPMGDWLISAKTSCKISAGTHLVEVDAWNGDALEEGNVDTKQNVRMLPFTTQYSMVSLGVGFQ